MAEGTAGDGRRQSKWRKEPLVTAEAVEVTEGTAGDGRGGRNDGRNRR
ncbi:MAG: hypothetical protein RBS58_09135 [Syntrophales bacterium]|nr:hypothetical protein [Syntrophales bacterium]MDX9922790.1 hypothetical protein [Syntrophales bacterium]